MNKSILTRRERNRLRTHKQLNDALLELILEKGYESVSVQDITDRADLSRATFYLHAKDKDELLWSAVEQVIHATENEVQKRYGNVLPPQPEFYGYLNIFEHIKQHQGVYKVILSKKGSVEIARRVQEYMVNETLEDINRYKVYSDIPMPPALTAQIVVGSIFSLVTWWLETPNEYSPVEMAKMLYQALHRKEPPILS